MSATGGTVTVASAGALRRVTLSNPPRFNAMTRAMWRQLRQVFLDLQADGQARCVLVQGEQGNFCAGGDIAEYPEFRFREDSLSAFHEGEVWGGLQAMLDCDVPIVAAIEGNCMGAGLEIAACCDIRLAAQSARFGAPIAKLGFPMAPREAQLLVREAGAATARAMLLEAALFDAEQLQARGFLTRVVADGQLVAHVNDSVNRILALAPQAARANKRTLRAIVAGAPDAAAPVDAYAYADSAEHREGIQAFLDKRPPHFTN
jgi:enoyl-CoA hydratase/carnithine racemase